MQLSLARFRFPVGALHRVQGSMTPARISAEGAVGAPQRPVYRREEVRSFVRLCVFTLQP